jgi:glutathionyl-hydroquinone reductase
MNTGVVFGLYNMLREGKVEQYLESLYKFQNDIRGPYILGDQFTLADIAFYPFLERAILGAPFYYPTFDVSNSVNNQSFFITHAMLPLLMVCYIMFCYTTWIAIC